VSSIDNFCFVKAINKNSYFHVAIKIKVQADLSCFSFVVIIYKSNKWKINFVDNFCRAKVINKNSYFQ